MNCRTNLATVASFDSNAAECAAAMTRPSLGFRAARYNPHAEVFQRLSREQADGAVPTGTIEAIFRERTGTWRYKARCPYCNGTHMHGGAAGQLPGFGERLGDCGIGEYALLAVEAAHA